MAEEAEKGRGSRTRTSDSTTVDAKSASDETKTMPDQERTEKNTAPSRRPRAKSATTEVSQETVDAVAASLAELKEKGSARLARGRTTVRSKDAEQLLDSIADSASDQREGGGEAKAGSGFAASLAEPFSAKTETVDAPMPAPMAPMTSLLFQEPDSDSVKVRRRGAQAGQAEEEPAGQSPVAQTPAASEEEDGEPRRRRRGSRGRRRGDGDGVEATKKEAPAAAEEPASAAAQEPGPDAGATVRRRTRKRDRSASAEPTALKGSTRLEAKRQRRKEGREAGRRRHTITESEYLARRESVNRQMLIREQDGLNQIAVLEDDVLVEHYVARHTQVSMVGNVYLGRVQNVLPSMEAAFVDIGKGRNAVLYAGEVNWEAAGLEGKPRKIEHALKSGDTVLVQVTKDPIGHKGARLTAQITLAGRHLVLVPSGAMTGISRKLPDKERSRLKKLLREIVPSRHGVIVRTAAEGASEEQLRADVERLTRTWEDIQKKSGKTKSAPMLLKGEPELAVRVVRDIFNEDFQALRIQGDDAYATIRDYVAELAPELEERVGKWTARDDIFAAHRVDEQLAKAFDRKVWLPSGGTLVIDRTEAMTVIDVNTGKFTGSGGTLEETVTSNNLEAAEEIVRQLRLRDIGGIIVIDFIDMVLEDNRELVLKRLIECLGRDRTRHQVAEVTSLGLVQMTRKRVGQGLVEAFSTTCEACEGRGYMTHSRPVEHSGTNDGDKKRTQIRKEPKQKVASVKEDAKKKAAMQSIAAAAKTSSDEKAAAGEHVEAPEPAKRRAVRRSHAAASTGTVVPASTATSAILSFPADK